MLSQPKIRTNPQNAQTINRKFIEFHPKLHPNIRPRPNK